MKLLAFLLVVLHMKLASQNISHEKIESSFEIAKDSLVKKIQKRGDLPHVSVKRELELLEELSSFELGRYLIERGGLNGHWIHYVVSHPYEGKLSGLSSDGKPFVPLENFLLNESPLALATQERFALFKEKTQSFIFEGCSLASIPSGIMAELLDLDYSKIKEFNLFGIDIDPEAILEGEKNARKQGLSSHTHFFQRDAWNLGEQERFDAIVSNGLTIYEPSEEKIKDLYHQFYIALKEKGVLITSFLTPPPIPNTKTEWKLEEINPKNALLQKIILSDILTPRWQSYMAERRVIELLREAGFLEIEIIHDKAHIFPTVVAKK